MFPAGSMLSREDRARLLRETVFKSSGTDPTPGDPGDLGVPPSRSMHTGFGAGTSDGLRGLGGASTSPEFKRSPSPHRTKDASPRLYQTAMPNIETYNSHPPLPSDPVTRTYELEKRRLEDEVHALQADLASLQHAHTHILSEYEEVKNARELTTRQNEELVERVKGAVKISSEEWTEANERVDVLIRENDILMEQEKSSQKEIERLNEELSRQSRQIHQTTADLHASRTQAAQLQQTLTTSVNHAHDVESQLKRAEDESTAVQVENDALRGEVRKWEGECRSRDTKIADYKRGLEEITSRYQTHVREAQTLAARERELLDNLKTTESERDDFKSKHASIQAEFESLSQSHTELTTISSQLTQRLNQLEDRVAEAQLLLSKETEKAEESKLELDKALIREQQSSSEIQRLTEKVLEAPSKARERADHEMNTIKAQYAAETHRLNEEVAALENKLVTMRHQSERAIRDKRSAENELQKLTAHLPEDSERIAMISEELNNKLRQCERERSAAVYRADGLHTKLQREEARFEKEKHLLAERSDEAFRRLRTVERELENTKEDRVKLYTRLTDSEHAIKKMADAKRKAAAQNEAELAGLTQRYEEQTKDLTSRLDTTAAAHTRTCSDYQALLGTHKQLQAQHANNMSAITSRHAHEMKHLQSVLSSTQQAAQELSGRVEVLDARCRDLGEKLAEERRKGERWEARWREGESKVEGLRRQMVTWTRRGEEWGEERKRLQRDLDRAIMERERLERDHRTHKSSSAIRNRSILLTPPLEEDKSICEDTNREVRDLRAEISRVKQRSSSLAARRGRSDATYRAMTLELSSNSSDGDSEDEEEE
ncbi:hypothetical protein DFS34DRAFT_286154 [Phlyctochytrium arcticum]|nr:hypothetical protein DFS34DRAFT_286154 [Phlyctochytrium arcticum]